MSLLEQEQFSSWLTTQCDMTFLSLPALTTELKHRPCITVQRSSDCAGLERLSFHTPSSRSLRTPNLRRFDGPISLVQDLIPGRPVSEVVIRVDRTLYDGLKPSQLMGSIAKSTVSIERLSIHSCPSALIDARTMERLLMSAGAKFGPSILHLEIGWAAYNEVRSPLSRFEDYSWTFISLIVLTREETFRSTSFNLEWMNNERGDGALRAPGGSTNRAKPPEHRQKRALGWPAGFTKGYGPSHLHPSVSNRTR